MRQYRRSLSAHGQVSPLFIADLVQPHLVGASFADIGCGAGVPVSVMRARWPWTESYIRESVEAPHFVGVDFSPRAVAYAREYGAYDRVLLADSAALPLENNEVDVALSIENLEHLFPEDVVPALEELARIARRRVVITTPWPWDVVNRAWLNDELNEARSDPDGIDEDEFRVLAGCVHKSALIPDQLAAAGFRCMSLTRRGTPRRHPVYTAELSDLDPSRIGPVLGIDRPALITETRDDYRQAYVSLLEASLALGNRTPKFKRRWYFTLASDRLRDGLSRM